jgi:hypothetical protein
MADPLNPQAKEMADESTVRNLAAQAEADTLHQRVRVAGTLDAKTIKVSSITAATWSRRRGGPSGPPPCDSAEHASQNLTPKLTADRARGLLGH